MDKAEARRLARERRRALPAEARAALSNRIRAHALGLPEVARARRVGCYVSVGSEVDTSLILRELLARGVVVAVPVVTGDAMRFVRLDHPWALVPGAHQIPEPRQPWTSIDGDSLDVILAPGVAFTRAGARLGSGRGIFDRYLALHPTPLRVGLAFSAQLVESVPLDPHDEAMDVIVTEDGALASPR